MTKTPMNALLLFVTTAAVVVAPVAAQPPTDQTFEGYEEVLEVQIPVNVVGKDGMPIRDLSIDDFKVTESGDALPISSFEVIDLEVLGPEMTAARADDVIPQAARRHVLLLFDLAFSDLSAVVRARQAAREFVLNSLHPSDLVAVATHSVETGPKLVVTFTPDRRRDAIDDGQ